MTQGLWLVGEFDGTSERTVAPKADGSGKQFTAFGIESVALVVSDDVKRVEWREGRRPDVSGLKVGDVVAVPVRYDGQYNGQPQWAGRALPVLIVGDDD